MKRRLFMIKVKTTWDLPHHGKTFKVIVRADSAGEAREMASKEHGREGKEVWLNSKKTKCSAMRHKGVKKVLMVEFAGD